MALIRAFLQLSIVFAVVPVAFTQAIPAPSRFDRAVKALRAARQASGPDPDSQIRLLSAQAEFLGAYADAERAELMRLVELQHRLQSLRDEAAASASDASAMVQQYALQRVTSDVEREVSEAFTTPTAGGASGALADDLALLRGAASAVKQSLAEELRLRKERNGGTLSGAEKADVELSWQIWLDQMNARAADTLRLVYEARASRLRRTLDSAELPAELDKALQDAETELETPAREIPEWKFVQGQFKGSTVRDADLYRRARQTAQKLLRRKMR